MASVLRTLPLGEAAVEGELIVVGELFARMDSALCFDEDAAVTVLERRALGSQE
jgi:hypothetical protein